MKKVKSILLKIKNFLDKNKFIIGGILLISTLVVPVVSYPLFGRFEVKLDEKRDPNEFPEDLSDDFGKEFDAYYSDRAPYRDTSINLFHDIDFFLASLYCRLAEIIDENYVLKYGDDVILGKDRWLYFVDEIHDCMRDNILSDDQLSLTDDIDRMIKDIEKMDKRVAFMVCPNKSTLYPEYLPKYYAKYGDLPTLVSVTKDYFERTNKSKILYSLDDLKENKSKEQLYYKHDSHHNEYAGLINYKILCDYFGDALGEYTFKKEIKRIEWDLTSMAGLSPKEDVFYTFNYRPEISVIDEEKVGNIEYYRTNNPNNRKLAIIGDSYNNSLRPFFFKDYAQTTFMHIDKVAADPEPYLSCPGFLEADTVVFLTVERFFSIRFVEQAISSCAHRVIADYIENNYL